MLYIIYLQPYTTPTLKQQNNPPKETETKKLSSFNISKQLYVTSPYPNSLPHYQAFLVAFCLAALSPDPAAPMDRPWRELALLI